MKEKITAAAIELFDRKGFGSTSIQDIVEALGVTKGTFYYYFSSKEELLRGIHLHYIDDLVSQQEEILSDHSLNSKQKLYRIIYMLISDIKKQGASAKVFTREIRHLNEEHYREITSKRDQFRFNMEQLLSDGINNKEFRQSLNPELIAFGILGVTNWSYNWFNPEGSVSDKELAIMFTDMLLKGIEMD
ncbi:TetR/AcrR family transcriptional regulator [Peribacillus sp. SCS-26]|uniref:TetR/AcrR family transcriptional regulator n=1 Tax=Paraperibacillus marinus TaxID=3115295 RepID=UPI0039065360